MKAFSLFNILIIFILFSCASNIQMAKTQEQSRSIAQAHEVKVVPFKDVFLPVKDKFEDFIVYKDSNNLKYYNFKTERKNQDDARKFCKLKGLRLMTKIEAESLSEELNADIDKLKKWIGTEDEEAGIVWTDATYSGVSLGYYILSLINGDQIYSNYTHIASSSSTYARYVVRCVGY